MTSIQDRLADAMSAAAGTVREAELRPLAVRQRRWHQAAWAAPAAAAVVLVIGLVVSASNGLFGTHQPAGPGHLPAAPHRFYLATDIGSWQTTVRSTATGKAVAVVPVPSLQAAGSVSPALATAGNGTFYIAAFRRGATHRSPRKTPRSSPRTGDACWPRWRHCPAAAVRCWCSGST